MEASGWGKPLGGTALYCILLKLKFCDSVKLLLSEGRNIGTVVELLRSQTHLLIGWARTEDLRDPGSKFTVNKGLSASTGGRQSPRDIPSPLGKLQKSPDSRS